MTDNLFAALPALPLQLNIASETLLITPLRVGELPSFARAIAPIARQIGAEPNWWNLLSQDGDAVIESLAIASRKPRDWVAALSLDEGVALAELVFEANVDFFIQRVVPLLTDASLRIQQRLTPPGPISSSASSSPVTAIPTS